MVGLGAQGNNTETIGFRSSLGNWLPFQVTSILLFRGHPAETVAETYAFGPNNRNQRFQPRRYLGLNLPFRTLSTQWIPPHFLCDWFFGVGVGVGNWWDKPICSCPSKPTPLFGLGRQHQFKYSISGDNSNASKIGL
jgi:hypothetical protein